MKTLQELIATREVGIKSLESLLHPGDGKDVDFTAIKAKETEIETLDTQIVEAKSIEEAMARNAKRLADARAINPADRLGMPNGDDSTKADDSLMGDVHVPAMMKSRTPKNFLKACYGNREEAQKAAYTMGQFVLGSVYGRKDAQDWCSKNGISLKAQSENVNTAGGFLVPIVLANRIIQLMEEFGVVRKLMHNSRMTSDTLTIPRRAGTVTAYFLTDNQTINASTKVYDMVSLTAKKLAAFVYYSNEIAEDAMIDIGDDLGAEIAWRFSAMEDQCGLLGDGTSMYGGIVGVGPAIKKAFNSSAGAGLIVGPSGSGTAWTSYTLPTFTSVMGSLPHLAWQRGRPTWVCSQQFYFNVMLNLMAAGGGNTIQSILQGPTGEPMFLGSPVVFSQVMTTKAGASQIDCFFGDLDLAADFGDRRQLTLATSDQIGFSADQIAIRGIERFDINVHDVGGANAASQAINPTYPQDGTTAVAGPVVALMSYSS